ncbi:uncharacterized protein LOC127102806 [Lathyrus oleraceus]|uniref:uncharacterized protein LOC127102806 n=1 Tax=Pisum sativum TaxID=3888 RepID=UPI0021D1708B|nr:uncharacterized protein LOC127102806 [Pisum sativum]
MPVSDGVPFSGVEGILDSRFIVEAIHLRKPDIDVNLTAKGGIRGLTLKFLIDKDFSFYNANSIVAFETILALLIYGLVTFPNIDYFVNVNEMRIFLIMNLVPTLLGDTYSPFIIGPLNEVELLSIVRLYCTSGLFRTFHSLLPIFKENKDCLRWSQRLMSLTNDDITWYYSIYDDVEIIDNYGEFSSVPLLGTQGGINYNLDLAKRQLRFAMKDKPNNILL